MTWEGYSRKEKALYLLSAIRGMKPANEHYKEVKVRLIMYLKETGGIE